MNKTRLLVSLVVAIAATFVALRHRTLRHLETEQTQLRQQIEEATEVRADIARKKTAPPALTNAVVSPNEHRELLRLRNEIGQLRRDLAAESNQAAVRATKPVQTLPTSTAVPTEGVVTKEQMVVKLSRAREEALQLIRAASDRDEWPVALGSADEFELLVTGKMSDIKLPHRTIAFREKQPWKAANGKWGRTYVFADGHSEIRHSPTEDFTELERQMTQIDPAPTQ